MTKGSYDIVPAAARIGISRAEAAALIGVSPPVFDDLVRREMMPKARAIGARRVWHRGEIEKSFIDLPFAETAAETDGRVPDKWD